MPTVCSDPEFEKNIELKRCRKDRETIIRKIGYSDECNPFGDSLLSTPFIWEKRFEQEKNEKYDEFLENCKNYRWYKFGVAPINIEKILEIRKRREVSDENPTRRPQRGNLFNYDTWIENEKKFEKLQIQSSSIIRIKEHRENIFDIIFWKVLTYSFFCEGNSFEETESISPLTHSLLSLTLVGLSGSLPYLTALCDKKLLPWVDNLMKRPNLDKNIHFIEFTSMLKQHKKIINTSTEIKLVDEWVDILDGLEVMINLEYNHNDKDSMENHEIKEIIKNKSLGELRSIMSEAQNLLNDEYWNNVVLNIKVFIARLNIEKIENIYDLNIESWATELLEKYNISSQVLKFEEGAENCTLGKVSNNNENDFSEDESSGQLIDLPFIEFSVPTSNNERKTIKENNLELQLPIVYSKIKAKYIWNQYNRNYYNEKSLPPKIIQGYSFKIIFPLLNRPENKHITPNWYLTTKKRYIENNNISIIDENKTIEDLLECEGEVPQKSKLLIISCNQCKYKDIGFSIIDREWETNPKYGYRSYFENATLYLNFNFKQKRYRR